MEREPIFWIGFVDISFAMSKSGVLALQLFIKWEEEFVKLVLIYFWSIDKTLKEKKCWVALLSVWSAFRQLFLTVHFRFLRSSSASPPQLKCSHLSRTNKTKILLSCPGHGEGSPFGSGPAQHPGPSMQQAIQSTACFLLPSLLFWELF